MRITKMVGYQRCYTKLWGQLSCGYVCNVIPKYNMMQVRHMCKKHNKDGITTEQGKVISLLCEKY